MDWYLIFDNKEEATSTLSNILPEYDDDKMNRGHLNGPKWACFHIDPMMEKRTVSINDDEEEIIEYYENEKYHVNVRVLSEELNIIIEETIPEDKRPELSNPRFKFG